MRDEAYRELRRLIVNGQLEPGERLRDQHLAEWLNVSRTPVREAITRLADEGMVEMAPNRFTRVRPLRLDDALEGYPLAAALNSVATESAGRMGLPPDETDRLGELTERYEWALLREDGRDAVDADEEFHRHVALLAGNRLLTAALDRAMPRLRQVEGVVAELIVAVRPNQHRQALELLTAGEAAGAAAVVGEEYRALGALVVSALRRSGPAAG
jgi:DNA-binding GntR family transcriptional regulator